MKQKILEKILKIKQGIDHSKLVLTKETSYASYSEETIMKQIKPLLEENKMLVMYEITEIESPDVYRIAGSLKITIVDTETADFMAYQWAMYGYAQDRIGLFGKSLTVAKKNFWMKLMDISMPHIDEAVSSPDINKMRKQLFYVQGEDEVDMDGLLFDGIAFGDYDVSMADGKTIKRLYRVVKKNMEQYLLDNSTKAFDVLGPMKKIKTMNLQRIADGIKTMKA